MNKYKFAVMYSYKIKRENLSQLRKINREAGKVYKRYGWLARDWTLVRKSRGDVLEVLYLDFYLDQNHYRKVAGKADRDKILLQLFGKFKALILPNSLKEKHYEVFD